MKQATDLARDVGKAKVTRGGTKEEKPIPAFRVSQTGVVCAQSSEWNILMTWRQSSPRQAVDIIQANRQW